MHWLDSTPSREIDPVLDCLTFLARRSDRPSSPVLLRAGLALSATGTLPFHQVESALDQVGMRGEPVVRRRIVGCAPQPGRLESAGFIDPSFGGTVMSSGPITFARSPVIPKATKTSAGRGSSARAGVVAAGATVVIAVSSLASCLDGDPRFSLVRQA